MKTSDGKGMIWKYCPSGDELNEKFYYEFLPDIENFFKNAEAIDGFDLQKATIKAFNSLRRGF